MFFNRTVLYGAIHRHLYVGFVLMALPQPGVDTISIEHSGKESLITHYLVVFHQVFDINMGHLLGMITVTIVDMKVVSRC